MAVLNKNSFVGLQIEKKELDSLIKDLDTLFPDSDTKLRNTLRTALRKSAKPLVGELRAQINRIKPTTNSKNPERDTGQLKKSIAIINGKTSRGRKPAVYVGPRVKGAYDKEDRSGFYFYFHEYGYNGIPGLRMLDATALSKGAGVLNSLVGNLKTIIAKRFNK